jgi:hypothetical protein
LGLCVPSLLKLGLFFSDLQPYAGLGGSGPLQLGNKKRVVGHTPEKEAFLINQSVKLSELPVAVALNLAEVGAVPR